MESCNSRIQEQGTLNRECVEEMGRIHQRMDRLEKLIQRNLAKSSEVDRGEKEKLPCSSKTMNVSHSILNPSYNEIGDVGVMRELSPQVASEIGKCPYDFYTILF